jgi:hypothetical protein
MSGYWRAHKQAVSESILHVYARRNILIVISRFIFPVKGIIVVLLSTWDRRLVRRRQMPSKNVLECKSLLECLLNATRVASKPVTVEEIQEQPDGSRQTVRIDAKRNSWQVDNHGVDCLALIKGMCCNFVVEPKIGVGDRKFG